MKQTTSEERSECAAHIEYARKHYAAPSDNDIEIDDTPELSIADDGVWVQAWVWVPTEHVTPEEADDDSRSYGPKGPPPGSETGGV